MAFWQGNFACDLSLDKATKFQTRGVFRQSDDGKEVVAISNAEDFPACVMSPMLALGWPTGSPLHSVVDRGITLRLKRTLEFSTDLNRGANEDITDNFQLNAEGLITKGGDGTTVTEIVVKNPRGKIDPITKNRLQSISAVLPFHETVFDAANKEEIRKAKERTIDVTGKVVFLTKNNSLIAAHLCSQWMWEVKEIERVYDFLENPLYVNRDLKVTARIESFGPITINGMASLRVDPENGVAPEGGSEGGDEVPENPGVEAGESSGVQAGESSGGVTPVGQGSIDTPVN